MSENSGVRVEKGALESFCTEVFVTLGMSNQQAADCSEILVAADLLGIGSHGVARLWRYVNGIKTGVMTPYTESETLYETPVSSVVDARGGIGLSLSKKVMGDVIKRAAEMGLSVASVRDSNHFGIAGYYAMMAVPENMIGIAMTNTAALGVPTFGRDAQFGTNPIAVAVPALKRPPFVLDMATTVVTRGKIECFHRENTALPEGWAVDTKGKGTSDAASLLQDMLYQRGGGILPLGGLGDVFGGHKGFGLGVLVDILSAVTSGGTFGRSVKDSKATSARVCHFFAALRIDMFRDPEEFKKDMDLLLGEIVDSEPAEGESRVYYAGLKEHEHTVECREKGVPLTAKVWEGLKKISGDLNIQLPGMLSGNQVIV